MGHRRRLQAKLLVCLVVSLLALQGAPAWAHEISLVLPRGWIPLERSAAISNDGKREIRIYEAEDWTLKEAAADCRSLPTDPRAAVDGAARRVGPPLMGRGWVACRIAEPGASWSAMSVRVQFEGHLHRFMFLLDGAPRRWSKKKLKRLVKELRGWIKPARPDEEGAVIVPEARTPGVPVGCGMYVDIPAEWKLMAKGAGTAFIEKGGKNTPVMWLGPIPDAGVLPAGLLQAASQAAGRQGQIWQENGRYLVEAEGPNARVHIEVFRPQGCAGWMEVFISGPPDDKWSITMARHRFLDGARLLPLDPTRAADHHRPRPGDVAHGATSGKASDIKAVKAWVKHLKGRATSGYSSPIGSGDASGGTVGQKKQSVLFCPDGRFQSSYLSEYYVSTPAGSIEDVDRDDRVGEWGVFEYNGDIYLLLWTQVGTQLLPLPRRIPRSGPVLTIGSLVVDVARMGQGVRCR